MWNSITKTQVCFENMSDSIGERWVEPTVPSLETTEPSELLGSDGARCAVKVNLMTPTGVEPVLPP